MADKDAANDNNTPGTEPAKDAAATPADDKAGAKPAADKTAAADDKTAAAEPPKTYTQAELDRQLAKKEKEWKKQAEDAAAKAKLSEDEKLKAENEELRQAIRMRDAREKVIGQLKAAGAKSPELLFQVAKGDLEFDDKGGLKNLKTIVDGLRLDHPEQFGIDKPGTSIDGGAGSPGTGEKLTPEMLEKMTPAEINKLPWEKVSAVLAGK